EMLTIFSCRSMAGIGGGVNILELLPGHQVEMCPCGELRCYITMTLDLAAGAVQCDHLIAGVIRILGSRRRHVDGITFSSLQATRPETTQSGKLAGRDAGNPCLSPI